MSRLSVRRLLSAACLLVLCFTQVAVAAKKHTVLVVLASGSAQGEALAGPFGTVSDIFITTRIDGRPHLKQVREAIGCFTMPKGELNAEWQKEWYQRLATTLGGTVSLRLVLPASGGHETDIFKGL